jgi:ATP-binding cassette subfamily B protein
VPQDIYLSDCSIRENIALGVELDDINDDLIKKVAEISQLSKFIERLPLKFDTLVGERGAKLSGGQLQRIGIARALYKQNQILILDEATNALDSSTEDRLLMSINNNYKHLTIIMISHRQKTLKYCNKIFDLNSKQYKTFKIPRFSKPQL